MTLTKRALTSAVFAALIGIGGASAVAAPPATQALTHAEDFQRTMAQAHALIEKDHAGVEQRLRAMIRAHMDSGADPAKAEEKGLKQVHQIMADAETSPEALAHLKVIIAHVTAGQ